MNIFGTYLSPNFMKMYSKTQQIAPFKKNSRGNMPPNLSVLTMDVYTGCAKKRKTF